jgi:hypothetical protein
MKIMRKGYWRKVGRRQKYACLSFEFLSAVNTHAYGHLV